MRSTVEGLRLLARAIPVGFWERVPGLRRRLIRVAIRLQNLPALPRNPPLPPPPVGEEAGESAERAGAVDAAPFDPARVGEERRERARERSGVPRGTALVVFLGRLIARERPLDVLALAGRFHPTEAHFLLVGDGPLAAVVDREIARSGLPHVRRVAAEPDVPALLAAADALVLPSEREGLPRVLLESLAAGTPVVATAAGLVASTLALTGGGVAVGRVADIDGLEQGLRGVLAEPPDPEAVRRAVVGHFDVKRMAAACGERLWPR